MDAEKKGKNIQSIERAVAVLDYLSQKPHGERLTVISKDLGLNKSTLFTIISTLEDLGCVTQNQSTGLYSLGLRLLGFAQALLADLDIAKIAKPYLRDLAGQFDEAVNLALMSGKEVLYVDCVQSSKSIRVEMRLHEKVPAHCCSTGKVFMAFMDSEKRRKLLDSMELRPRTIYSISNRGQLEGELDVVRERGYAYDREEYEIGLTCIACPVYNSKGEVAAAISLNAPSSRMLQIDQNLLIDSMKNVAFKLTQQLNALGV